MTNILLCTGKKKAVDQILKQFQSFAREGNIDIIATKKISKKVFLWNYDELKILFTKKTTKPLELENALIKSVDFLKIKQRNLLTMKLSSPKKDDNWLKFNILKLSAPLKLHGGTIAIREQIHKESQFRTKRVCHMTLNGPTHMVLSFRDLLINDKLADPDTVEYIL